MRGEPFGLPHEPVIQGRAKRSTNRADWPFWTGFWIGHGSSSDVVLEIPDASWESIARTPLTEARVRVDMGSPRTLTHVDIECDNKFQALKDQDSTLVYIEYSHNGDTWSRFEQPGLFVGYIENAGGSPRDDLRCFIWIPRSKIKARHWGVVIPTQDFYSDYSDSLWHVSEFRPGSLDAFTDVEIDLADTGESIDLWTYEDVDLLVRLPAVNAGKAMDTGSRLAFLCVSRGGLSTGNGYKAFWTDKQSLTQYKADTDWESYPKKSIPIWTKTGFIMGIGDHSSTDWTIGNSYVSGGTTVTGDPYAAFGFANKPAHGCAVIRSRGFTSVVPNTLGVLPQCVWVINMADDGEISNDYLSHPSYPGDLIQAGAYSTTLDVDIDEVRINLPEELDEYKGIVLLKHTTGFFNTGTYVGTGVTGLAVDTGNVVPKMVIIKRMDAATSMYTAIKDSQLRHDIGREQTDVTLTLTPDGFDVDSTHVDCNNSGSTYAWWAFG